MQARLSIWRRLAWLLLIWATAAHSQPGSVEAGANPLIRAEALIGSGRHAAAVALLERVQRTDASARASYLLGFALIQLYRFDEAESHLRRAVEASPGQADWRHALARALLEQGKNRAALGELERAIELDDRPEFHYAVAMCALNLGQLARAERALNDSLRLAPDQHEALYQLGRIRIDRGDYAGAIEPLRRSSESNPNQVEARYLLALAQRHGGEPEAAAAGFEAVLQRIPGHVGALFNLSSVLAQLGRDEAAATARARFQAMTALQDEIEFLKAGNRKNPANLDGRLRLSQLLLETGRNEQAVRELLAARQLDPGHAPTYRVLERAFERLGAPARARQAAQIAAELERQR